MIKIKRKLNYAFNSALGMKGFIPEYLDWEDNETIIPINSEPAHDLISHGLFGEKKEDASAEAELKAIGVEFFATGFYHLRNSVRDLDSILSGFFTSTTKDSKGLIKKCTANVKVPEIIRIAVERACEDAVETALRYPLDAGFEEEENEEDLEQAVRKCFNPNNIAQWLSIGWHRACKVFGEHNQANMVWLYEHVNEQFAEYIKDRKEDLFECEACIYVVINEQYGCTFHSILDEEGEGYDEDDE